MSSTDLVMAIALAVAVAILGVAMCWAFINAHRDSARWNQHSSSQRQRRKSWNQLFKGKGG